MVTLYEVRHVRFVTKKLFRQFCDCLTKYFLRTLQRMIAGKRKYTIFYSSSSIKTIMRDRLKMSITIKFGFVDSVPVILM